MASLGFFVVLLGISKSTGVMHSLSYIVTTVSGMDGFPEYSEVINVDGQELVYYNCSLRKILTRNHWIEKNFDPDFWKLETERNIHNHQLIKAELLNLKQRLNLTDGPQIYQWMYGIEMDEETNELNGYELHAFNGNDFLYFDLKVKEFVAVAPKAILTRNSMNNIAKINYRKNMFANFFPEVLKKYVSYGGSYLTRTVYPIVSLLQKTPSSPVCCHATGFYPKEAELFWRKNGVEIHRNVDKGHVLPNNDGTFQMSADLSLPSSNEEWTKYECVFQLSGVKEDIITKLDKNNVKSNKGSGYTTVIIIVVLGLFFVACSVFGWVCWRRNAGFRSVVSSSSSSSTENPNPKEESSEEQEMMMIPNIESTN